MFFRMMLWMSAMSDVIRDCDDADRGSAYSPAPSGVGAGRGGTAGPRVGAGRGGAAGPLGGATKLEEAKAAVDVFRGGGPPAARPLEGKHKVRADEQRSPLLKESTKSGPTSKDLRSAADDASSGASGRI